MNSYISSLLICATLATMPQANAANTVSRSTAVSFVSILYRAALLRTNPSSDQGGMEYWVNALVQGRGTCYTVAYSFVHSSEARLFVQKNMSNSQFVKYAYVAVLGRYPDAGGFAYWKNRLNSIAQTTASTQLVKARIDLLNLMLTSDEFGIRCARTGIE